MRRSLTVCLLVLVLGRTQRTPFSSARALGRSAEGGLHATIEGITTILLPWGGAGLGDTKRTL